MLIEQINEYARIGDDGNFKVLVGRNDKNIKEKLWKTFFLGGKSFSVHGANGIGKTYLVDWLMEDVQNMPSYEEWLTGYTSEKGVKVCFCKQEITYNPTGDTADEQIISYWKKTVQEFPGSEELVLWFEPQEQENYKKIIENKDKDIQLITSEVDLQNYLRKLMKAYKNLHVEIRLILDEFGTLKGKVFPAFFDAFREIVNTNKNLSVLYISREHLNQIASENERFSNGIDSISLRGFTITDKMNLFSQYHDYFLKKYRKDININHFAKAEYYCGMHPASWTLFFECLSYALFEASGDVTQEVIDEVLGSTDFILNLAGNDGSVADQMYGLMKDAALNQGQDRTYLQSFYDSFIGVPQEVNESELEKLYSNGYIVKIKKKYLGKEEKQFQPIIIGDFAYLPISEFCTAYIKEQYIKDYPALPVQVEPVEEPEVLEGEVEGGNAATTQEEAQPAFAEKVLLMMGNIMEGFMNFIADMQNRSDKKMEEMLDKFLNLHSEDMQAFRKMISESNKTSVENIKNFLEGQAKQDKGNKEIIASMLEVLKEVTNTTVGVVKDSLETVKYVTGPSAPSLAEQIAEATKADREEAEKLQQQLDEEQQARAELELKMQNLQQAYEDQKELNEEEKRSFEIEREKANNALAEKNQRIEEIETKRREAEERAQEAEQKIVDAAKKSLEELYKTKYANVFVKEIDANYVLNVYKNLYSDTETARIPSEKQIENTISLFEPNELLDDFRIAFFLHELFDDMSQHGLSMDYTVLVMLYSRLYESFVKKQHFRMYQLVFPDVKASKNGTQTYGSRSLTYDKLTIGHFSYPISDEENKSDAVDDNDNPRIDSSGNTIKEAAWNRETLVNNLNSGLLSNASAIVDQHGESITKVREIRNAIMHDRTTTDTTGNEKTPVELLKELIEELFTKSAFINILKIRDAFDLRDVVQKVEYGCFYPREWFVTYAGEKTCNLKKIAFRLADELCRDAGLPERNIVTYSETYLYDSIDNINEWTSIPRVYFRTVRKTRLDENGQPVLNADGRSITYKVDLYKRRFVKTYQWKANAPLFKVIVACNEEDSEFYKAEIEVNGKNKVIEFVDFRSRAEHVSKREKQIEWLKEHWEKYVEQCEVQAAAQAQTDDVSDAAATLDTSTNADSNVPDTRPISDQILDAPNVLFYVEERKEKRGKGYYWKGKIEWDGNRYNASMPWSETPQEIEHPEMNGPYLVKASTYNKNDDLYNVAMVENTNTTP